MLNSDPLLPDSTPEYNKLESASESKDVKKPIETQSNNNKIIVFFRKIFTKSSPASNSEVKGTRPQMPDFLHSIWVKTLGFGSDLDKQELEAMKKKI